MFGHPRQDYERNSLIYPCRYWIDRLSDDKSDALVAAILDVFHEWKLRQVDANGYVKVVSAGGGLLNISPTERLVPYGDVEPWQCAGPFIANDIDLALKLWLDNDPSFSALVAAHGLWTVFAVVGLWSARTATLESLIRLNGLLAGVLVDEANEYRRLAQSLAEKINADKRQVRANLARAREAARQQADRKSDELRRSLQKAAFDYWWSRPDDHKRECIAYLRMHGFERWAPGTIGRIIAGVRSSVRDSRRSSPRPKSGLYDTSQKRNG